MGKQNAVTDLRRVIKKIGHNRYLELGMCTVLSESPLEVLMDGTNVVLSAEDITVSERLTNHTVEIEMDGVTRTAKVKNSLQRGDRALLMYDSSDNRTQFVLIDRVLFAEDL
ncbi:DUF2577 domain-containing protein [Exiguobacterium sp. JMULE1]|uniref:DUF2577 family protein n=1 Tax=Exiguobacterium sp. JMULE1 TaxID=2518339 RepID=UPI00157556C7|nr:DUF2577 family protein [Exiguobacterium sp. JMULE1]NTY10347.1 DUF2577 domain-containing protein [Exiguobacterium sp. JMULE1]